MKKLVFFLLLLIISTGVFAQQAKTIVYFPFNKFHLTNESIKTLDSLEKECNRNTVDSLKIFAYCDSIGANDINDVLSYKRAVSVQDYLVYGGIISNGIIRTNGFGKRKPVNDNSNEKLRALNRRVEVFVYYKPAIEDSAKHVGLNRITKSFPAIEKMEVGKKFILKNMNFYGSRHQLLPASLPVLDSLVQLMKENMSLEIEIEGYVCCMPPGVDGTDMETGDRHLSVARAKTVYDYLIGNGIDSTRLSYRGFGSKPLVSEISEENRITNRRVEIKVLKK